MCLMRQKLGERGCMSALGRCRGFGIVEDFG